MHIYSCGHLIKVSNSIIVNSSFYRAHVIVTDLEDLQTLLRANIKENQTFITKGSITAKVLKWFVLLFFFVNLMDLKTIHKLSVLILYICTLF